ncbi:MAG TPA: N-acetyl-gamma-glutamyl-phosphate reductase [Syntrophorhabdaceae bacterium]|nr:N-acetyl-gamma-glutamyl-phosphate reductase [Syntrophorhabdaceae bacterium]
MLNIGIIGATGYTGVVLISSLLSHPEVRVTLVTSNTYKGKKISDVFPLFRGTFENILEATDNDHRGKCDVFFLCLPHGSSMEMAKKLYDGHSIVIDLSADFRFEDIGMYESAYVPHTARELVPKAVFGLPELYRDSIRNAKLIGNPGCYPTSAILALYPFLKKGVISGDIFVDSKSGVSGAGREAKTGSLFCEVSEGFRPYGIGVHRHQPEIQKEIGKLCDSQVLFVPHLVPMNRGILTTVYAKLKTPVTTREALDIMRSTYQNEPFVRVLDEGNYPDTRYVRYSNFCDLSVKAFNNGTIVILSAIDNLIKGASGQAVQNMNIALGLEETNGLSRIPQFP